MSNGGSVRRRTGGEEVKDEGGGARVSSAKELAELLRARRKEAVEGGLGEAGWREVVGEARSELLKGRESANGSGGKKRKSRSAGRSWCGCCTLVFRVVWVCFLLLVLAGVLLYYCKPLAFFLQRNLHTKIYTVARPFRQGMLVLSPFLELLGVRTFSECMVLNPFLMPSDQCPCLTVSHVEEWQQRGTLPPSVLEGVERGEVWLVRGASVEGEEVSVETLQQFSLAHSGGRPQVCSEIVGGSEGGLSFYHDLFNEERMRKFLQLTAPWSFSWIECPNEKQPLTLRSLLPPPSYLPPHIHTSTMSLFSVATEWATSYHYHGDLPSSLLSLLVVRGEVRVVPMVRSERCLEVCPDPWEAPLMLRRGDMVLLDHTYWTYEVQSWTNYTLTVTTPLLHKSQ